VQVRRFLPALLAAALLPTLSAGSPPFERRWHWFEAGAGRSVALAPEGGYVIGAGASLGGAAYGALLVWVDSLGETTALRTVSGLDNGSGYLCRMKDGGYVIAGTYDTGHVFARKFGTAGDSVWAYLSPTRGLVQAVIGTADGGCLIVGQIPSTMYDFGAIKLDSTGAEEWNRYYEDPGIYASLARGVARTSDGGYILCGDADDYMDSYTRLVRTDSAGLQIWSRLYFGAVEASFCDVSETSGGGFLAAGLEWDTLASRNRLYLLRADSLGMLVGTHGLAAPGAATQAAALDTAGDGGYVVTGQIDWGDSARAWLVKLDANADTVWTGVLPGSGREQAADVQQTADGGYVVAGTSDSAGGSVLLIKTDSLGHIEVGISEERPTPGERIALSVEPSPSSGVVRVEWSVPTSSGPATLRVYDSQGRLVHSSFVIRHSSLSLGLRSVPAGVYLLRLDSDLGSSTRKLVIE
jgi:hypothetical protein